MAIPNDPATIAAKKKKGTDSDQGLVEELLDDLGEMIGIGDSDDADDHQTGDAAATSAPDRGAAGGDGADPDAPARMRPGATPAAGAAPGLAGGVRGSARSVPDIATGAPHVAVPDPAAGSAPADTLPTAPAPSWSEDVSVTEMAGDPLGGTSVGVDGDATVTVDEDGVGVSGEADIGFTGPGGAWGQAHVDVDEDGHVEVTDVEGDLGDLVDLGIDTPEDYEDSGKVSVDEDGAHGEYEFGNPNAKKGDPVYSGDAEFDLTNTCAALPRLYDATYSGRR